MPGSKKILKIFFIKSVMFFCLKLFCSIIYLVFKVFGFFFYSHVTTLISLKILVLLKILIFVCFYSKLPSMKKYFASCLVIYIYSSYQQFYVLGSSLYCNGHFYHFVRYLASFNRIEKTGSCRVIIFCTIC